MKWNRLSLEGLGAVAVTAGFAWGLMLSGSTHAADQYGPGVTAKEITIGQSAIYSGPISSVAIYGRVETAYFKMINERGGINGRKINLISLDNAYLPARAVQDSRELVEQDHVFAEAGTLGTSTNAAIQKYLNQQKVPQLFISTGSSRFNDPKHFPWTVPFVQSYRIEGRIYARYMLEHHPDAKVAALYINSDLGKDFLDGFREYGGGKAAKMIVATQSSEPGDPTVDSQVIQLKASGADTLLLFTNVLKHSIQALKKVDELNWHPLRIVPAVSSSIHTVLEPAGLKNSVGILSLANLKTPGDPRWANDQDMKDYFAFMQKYLPNEDPHNDIAVIGYVNVEGIAMVLARCGDLLTRDNLLKQATSLHATTLPMLLPGVTLSNSSDDYTPFHEAYLVRFDGKSWVPMGEVLNSVEIKPQ